MIDLELFAGPGGWSEGRRLAGATLPMVGIEHDHNACVTAVRAGHWRVQADVATYPTYPFVGKVRGGIFSPPCPSFSTAGSGAGKDDVPNVLHLIADYASGRLPGEYTWHDERSALTAQPMRYITALKPRWVACEQVPPVLPIWKYMAERLRGMGYRTWCGILSAEEYGVVGSCPLHEEETWASKSLAYPVKPVWNAERLSQFVRNLGCVPSDVGTLSDSDLTGAALAAVIDLAPLIAMAYASAATVAERAKHLVALVEHEEQLTQPGAVGAEWTSVATFTFASTVDIDVNIASSLSDYLAARLLAAKSSTTSMAAAMRWTGSRNAQLPLCAETRTSDRLGTRTGLVEKPSSAATRYASRFKKRACCSRSLLTTRGPGLRPRSTKWWEMQFHL